MCDEWHQNLDCINLILQYNSNLQHACTRWSLLQKFVRLQGLIAFRLPEFRMDSVGSDFGRLPFSTALAASLDQSSLPYPYSQFAFSEGLAEQLHGGTVIPSGVPNIENVLHPETVVLDKSQRMFTTCVL